MCDIIVCEICNRILDAEEYHQHIKECKPELEKVDLKVEVKQK
ncbi:MAG: hypothetical protein QW416_04990 [Candidatus Nitrosocaldaceae archaeon]